VCSLTSGGGYGVEGAGIWQGLISGQPMRDQEMALDALQGRALSRVGRMAGPVL
jgi:hypothetical protein